MQKRIWLDYNRNLVQRGSLCFLIHPKLGESIKTYKKVSSEGRPTEYSDAFIQVLAAIKALLQDSLQNAGGICQVNHGFFLKDVKLPTYSLICKRLAKLQMELPRLPRSGGVVVILDASGMKVMGEGKWKVKVHGRGRPRKCGSKSMLQSMKKCKRRVGEVTLSSHFRRGKDGEGDFESNKREN